MFLICRSILLLFILSIYQFSSAQINHQPSVHSKSSSFLKKEDRVVFLGNSLFENDLQYGYLETMLTTRWPDQNITYRNIGWTGDMVKGEARGTFTNPPTPYEHLLDQLTKTQPTVVFIAYGGLEAMKGQGGLGYFTDGLKDLIDTIHQLGARSVLLSPLPIMLPDSVASTSSRNELIKLYSKTIEKVASARNIYFIDIFNPIKEIQQTVNITDNGIHLNEKGYYHLALILEDAFGLPRRNNDIKIDIAKENIQIVPAAQITDRKKNNESFSFVLDENHLVLSLPATASTDGSQTISIKGLKKGYYTLTNNNRQIITASAKQWAEGVNITRGIIFDQAEELRELIIKKNEVFFQQYRPINETYITGFRSYEQGRHVKGLNDMNIIIKWLEGQIAQQQHLKPVTYQLSKLN